ncbi:hypothetical protein [Mucilaginibacter xinganensis]|uniref:Uncharacterized protein n=1 Tax=Mucilaginibacter xinganensis TaxID=1234841 RepID=A0A223NWY9_9SPHI|nr:hypothetical protein [Mucilaginibacter xinganensis]ASU34375.1 hypothetical protein MuYL_2488 [Mucilaginibacter xinganensis]
MNTSTIPGFVKYKAGNKVIYQGKEVFVSSTKRTDNKIVICDDENLQTGFNYEPVYPYELSPVRQLRQGISTKPQTPEKRAELSDMTAFFDLLAQIVPFNCDNCFKPLYAVTKKSKRCVTAHIFPKAYFESIATNPDNILFMGADFIGCPCNCHDRWDANLDSRKKLTRAYSIALIRFEILKPFMTDKELVAAYEYLGLEVEV